MIAGANRQTLPRGFHITLVNGLLVVMQLGDETRNVYAACRVEQGVLCLIGRFWDLWRDWDQFIQTE